MLESLILGGIFIVALGYFIYKIIPKKDSCGCGNCNCDKK